MVVKSNKMPIQENHSVLKQFTIAAKFKAKTVQHLTHANGQPDRVMSNAKIAENVNDRELFSELIDNPINPLLIHMVPPFMDEKDPMFSLQINGEAVWESRQVYGHPMSAFDLIQRSILPLRYQLFYSSRDRIGNAVAASIRRFCQKIKATTNGKKRKRLKAETWLKLAINPKEIQRTPNDVMAQLIQQNSNLSTTVEDRAADLYDQMQRKLAHSVNRLWISPIRQRKVSVYRCTSSDCNQPLYKLKFAMRTLNRPCRIFL